MKVKFFPTYGKRLIKSELIEVIIPAGSTKTRFQLPNNPNLRNTYLWNIQAYNAQAVPKSILSPTAVVPIGLFNVLWLSLQMYDGDNFVWQKPLADLNSIAIVTTVFISGNETQQDCFTGQRVNWPKSYIEVSVPGSIPSDKASSVLLEIYYSDMETETKRREERKATFKNRS